MKLGQLISDIERWSGTGISDPLLLEKDVVLLVKGQEVNLDSVDVDGDVILLQDEQG